MRTAKYHDHAVLKVVILLILVVIGLFVYKTLVNQPCEHTADGNWIVSKEATCTEDGSQYKKCTKCGEHFGEQKISALGHKVDNKEIVITEPTCTKTGTAYKACSVCKEQVGNIITVPVTDHTPDNAVVENEVQHTATTVGVSYESVVYCKDCDHEISREKVEVKHTVTVSSNIVEYPTCTEPGLKAYSYFCKECDKPIDAKSEAIAPKGHSFAWDLKHVDNGDGVTDADDIIVSAKCSTANCGHVYNPDVDINVTIMVTKHESSIEPTCVSGYYTFVATVTYNNVATTLDIGFKMAPVESHKLYIKLTNSNGELINRDYDYTADGYYMNNDGYVVDDEGNLVDFLIAARRDDGSYNISTPGIYLLYKVEEGQTEEEAKAAAWDENGFAYGAFYCTDSAGHSHWISVIVYNDLADVDTPEVEIPEVNSPEIDSPEVDSPEGGSAENEIA